MILLNLEELAHNSDWSKAHVCTNCEGFDTVMIRPERQHFNTNRMVNPIGAVLACVTAKLLLYGNVQLSKAAGASHDLVILSKTFCKF